MGKQHTQEQDYNPPFFLQKLYNYQKAIYQRKGHWTEKEKVKYGVFLELFKTKFQDRHNPILNKMFRVMSDFIKTRNHNQCRSHHQKMERQRYEVSSILESIKSKYHPRQYELYYQKYTKHIRTLNIDVVLQQKGFTPHKNVENRRKRNQKRRLYIQCKREQENNMDDYQIIQLKKINHTEQKVELEELKNHNADGQYLFQKDMITEKNQKYNEKIQATSGIIKHQLGLFKEFQQSIKQAQIKPQQKTGLQYDSENQVDNQKNNVALVQIPNELSMHPQKQTETLIFKGGDTVVPGRPMVQFISGFQNSFPPSYSMVPRMIQESYIQQIKQLEDQKQWHLNEANKYYIEMNDHMRRANICQQSKQIILNNFVEIKRGYCFPHAYTAQF